MRWWHLMAYARLRFPHRTTFTSFPFSWGRAHALLNHDIFCNSRRIRWRPCRRRRRSHLKSTMSLYRDFKKQHHWNDTIGIPAAHSLKAHLYSEARAPSENGHIIGFTSARRHREIRGICRFDTLSGFMMRSIKCLVINEFACATAY